MNNITKEHVKKFCNTFNSKLFMVEPMNREKTEYKVIVNTGVPGPMPEFSVSKNHFKGLGENHQINLTSKWVKYLEELKSAINEPIVSL